MGFIDILCQKTCKYTAVHFDRSYPLNTSQQYSVCGNLLRRATETSSLHCPEEQVPPIFPLPYPTHLSFTLIAPLCFYNPKTANSMHTFYFIFFSNSEDPGRPGLLNFADLSVNSQPIFMKFYTHYFPFMSWLPWKFREVLISIVEVRPFDM